MFKKVSLLNASFKSLLNFISIGFSVKELQPKNSRIKPDVNQKFYRNIFGEKLDLKKLEFQTIKKRWFDKNDDTLIFASYSEGLDLFLKKINLILENSILQTMTSSIILRLKCLILDKHSVV